MTVVEQVDVVDADIDGDADAVGYGIDGEGR